MSKELLNSWEKFCKDFDDFYGDGMVAWSDDSGTVLVDSSGSTLVAHSSQLEETKCAVQDPDSKLKKCLKVLRED